MPSPPESAASSPLVQSELSSRPGWLQGKLCWVLQTIFAFLGLGKTVKRLVNAPTMEEQKQIWDTNFMVHFIKHGPRPLVWIFVKLVSLFLFNRAVLW